MLRLHRDLSCTNRLTVVWLKSCFCKVTLGQCDNYSPLYGQRVNERLFRCITNDLNDDDWTAGEVLNFVSRSSRESKFTFSVGTSH